jgi:predicted small secreted protein
MGFTKVSLGILLLISLMLSGCVWVEGVGTNILTGQGIGIIHKEV